MLALVALTHGKSHAAVRIALMPSVQDHLLGVVSPHTQHTICRHPRLVRYVLCHDCLGLSILPRYSLAQRYCSTYKLYSSAVYPSILSLSKIDHF